MLILDLKIPNTKSSDYLMTFHSFTLQPIKRGAFLSGCRGKRGSRIYSSNWAFCLCRGFQPWDSSSPDLLKKSWCNAIFSFQCLCWSHRWRETVLWLARQQKIITSTYVTSYGFSKSDIIKATEAIISGNTRHKFSTKP